MFRTESPSRSSLLGAFALLAVSAILSSGCAETTRFRHAEEIDPIAMREFQRLEARKAVYWRDGFREREFDFGKDGQVQVSRWELQGVPGETYVKVDFTWVNTSTDPIRHAFVTLYVLDEDGVVQGASQVRLYNPAGYDLYPENTVTSYLRAETGAVDLAKDRWSWGVMAEAEVSKYPTGAPPALVVPRRPDTPATRRMQIGWHSR
jgi:hypothetical protein